MLIWSVFFFSSLVCLGKSSPVASGPPVILRGGSVDARAMRLLMNAHPNAGEVRPECILNPARMGFDMRPEDNPYFNPDDNNHKMLVDEEGDEGVLPETPEEHAVPAEGDNTLSESPEQPDHTTQAEGEAVTTDAPTATTLLPREEESTTVSNEETSTHHDEEMTTVETAEEHSEQPEEEKPESESETPEEEPKIVEEPGQKKEPASKDCGHVAPGSRRRSKSRPVPETDEDPEEAPRKGGSRGGTVYKDFFPVTFGGREPSRTRGSEGGRGAAGSVTAIANSFSQGRGAIASSSAVAHGTPDAGEYRHSRRNSRYRL